MLYRLVAMHNIKCLIELISENYHFIWMKCTNDENGNFWWLNLSFKSMATKHFLMKYSWKCWSKTQFSMKTEILAEALLDVQLLTRLNYLKMSKKLSWIYFIRTVRLCLHLNILRNYFKIEFFKRMRFEIISFEVIASTWAHCLDAVNFYWTCWYM